MVEKINEKELHEKRIKFRQEKMKQVQKNIKQNKRLNSRLQVVVEIVDGSENTVNDHHNHAQQVQKPIDQPILVRYL